MTPATGGRDRGFSLIEMLVVIVVLGIVAVVVVFTVGGLAGDGEAAAYDADRRVIDSAQQAHRAQHGWFATEAELVGAGLLRSASQLHDIEIASDGDYRLVQVGPGLAEDARDESAAGTTTTVDTPSTSVAPSSVAPSSVAPSSVAPSSVAPSSVAPSSVAPTSVAPTSVAPTSVAPTSVAPTSVAPTTSVVPTSVAPTTSVVPPSGVTCAFTVSKAWDSGANGDLTITNKSGRRVTAWTVQIARRGKTIDLWNAANQSSSSNSLTASDLGWNATVENGLTATPTGGGISGSGVKVGDTFPCTVVTPVPSAASVTCTFALTKGWGTGANAALKIVNGNSGIGLTSWTVRITHEGSKIDFSGADVVTSDANRVTVTNQSWNGVVAAAGSAQPTTASVTGTGLTDGRSFPCAVTAVS